jgi:diamine N-acetyltransferase
MSKITLKPITEKISVPIAELDAGDDGKYVPNNAITLIQALFKKDLKSVRGIYLGTGKDAQPIGLILVHSRGKKKLEIGRFMIDKNYQGKGYGKEAFTAILKLFVKKYKPDMVELDTRNPNAIKLYKKFGFVEYKTEPNDKKGNKVFLRVNVKDILRLRV